MDMHTELKAVPHASLRNPNPERPRKVLKSLGVFKRNGSQSLKSTTKRQGDDGRTCLPSEVLGLASCHPEKEKCRYVGERPHRYQCSMQASSLGWHLHEQPAPLLESSKHQKREQSERIPVIPRVTHTHTMNTPKECKRIPTPVHQPRCPSGEAENAPNQRSSQIHHGFMPHRAAR